MTEKSSTDSAAPESAAPTTDAAPTTTSTDDAPGANGAGTAPITPVATPGNPEKARDTVKNRDAAEALVGGELAPPPTKDEARIFAREFLLGELIKAVKTEFLTLGKTFTQMKEFEQEQLLRRVQHRLEGVVKDVIETIAADARLTFRADVDSVTFKDGVKASLKLGKSEHAHILADQAGKSVLIVVEDFAKFLNPGDESKGVPDQPSLFDKSRAAAESEASGGEKPKPPGKTAKKRAKEKAAKAQAASKPTGKKKK